MTCTQQAPVERCSEDGVHAVQDHLTQYRLGSTPDTSTHHKLAQLNRGRGSVDMGCRCGAAQYQPSKLKTVS
jgi:hypothetical protein